MALQNLNEEVREALTNLLAESRENLRLIKDRRDALNTSAKELAEYIMLIRRELGE